MGVPGIAEEIDNDYDTLSTICRHTIITGILQP